MGGAASTQIAPTSPRPLATLGLTDSFYIILAKARIQKKGILYDKIAGLDSTLRWSNEPPGKLGGILGPAGVR